MNYCLGYEAQSVFIEKYGRTRHSLYEELPIRMADKSFKENDIFSLEKIVGSDFELSAKGL